MPYNIALPDGRVVTNIPDDVTPQQAKARLLEAYPDIAKMTPPAVGEFATPKLAAPVEERSTLQYLKDLGLSLQTGFTQDIRSRGAALGTTGTAADKFATEASAHLEGLKSAAGKKNQQEIARILESAKDKGILDQVVAGAKAFGVDPGMFVASAAGSLPSSILFGLFGKPVQATAGAISGAGVVKTAMYDTVKEELTKAGLPPEEVEKRAMAAQDYFGKNPGMILAGAGLGAIEAITGLEKTVSKVLLRRVVQDVGKEELEAIAKQGLVKTVAKGVVGEAPLEFAQGAQEQLASNIALQNAGVDTPTMRGVISQGVIEGLAAGVLGGAVGPIQRAQARNALAQNDPAVAEIKNKIDGLQNTPPPPGSDEERVLQLAAQLEARGNMDRQNAMIMAMSIVAKENAQSEKIDGPKPPEITGGAPLFIFDTAEQAQERTRLLKLNRPKENFAFQEMPNGKFGIYKIPVETTGVTNVAEPIDETGGVSTELLGERDAGVPAGGVATPVTTGLDVAGAVTEQPDVGEAVQPATLDVAAAPAAVPIAETTLPEATTITEEPSVTETPEAVETEEERQAEPAATAAPESTEVISAVETEANAAIEEVNAATEELTAAMEERDTAAATREKGQGEPAALRRMTQKASEKLEAAISGKSGLINVIQKLDVELDRARTALEPYGGENFSEDMLRRRAETTEEEFGQDIADMETAYSYFAAVKRARAQAIRSLAEFEANPVFDRGGVHPAKARALEAIRALPYADKLDAYKEVSEKTEKLLEAEKAAEPAAAPAKPAAAPTVTVKKKRQVVIPPTSQARVSKRVATSLKTDPTFNQFSGMSITASLQHIAETGNPFERALATRLLAKDNRAGVKDTKMYVLDEEGVQELENTEADMEGAAGLYFLGKNGDVIFLRGEQFDENGINNQTVLHEALHATVNKRIIYAMYARELGLPVSDNLERTVAELNELLARAETALDQFLADNKTVPENIQHLIDGGAFDNVTEFVTYGMTDPAMQRFLRDNVEGVVTKRNGLADFVRLILDMMGLGPEHVSGLRDLIEYTNNLAASVSVDPATARAVLDTTKENRVLDIQAASKAAKRNETKSETIQRKIEESADADQTIEELGSLSTVAKNPKLWGEYLSAKFTDINVDGMNVLLAAMPTNVVVEMGVDKGITRLADIDSDTREMATMRTRILNRVQEIATPWIKLSPPIQKQLGKVMAYATLAQVDPASQKNVDKTLDDMYKALPDEAKAVYKNVRDFYADQYALYQALLERAAIRPTLSETAEA